MELYNRYDLECELTSYLLNKSTDLDSRVDFTIKDSEFVIKLKEGLDYVIKDNKIVVLRYLTDSQLKALSVLKDKKISDRFTTNKFDLISSKAVLNNYRGSCNEFFSLLGDRECVKKYKHHDVIFVKDLDEFINKLVGDDFEIITDEDLSNCGFISKVYREDEAFKVTSNKVYLLNCFNKPIEAWLGNRLKGVFVLDNYDNFKDINKKKFFKNYRIKKNIEKLYYFNEEFINYKLIVRYYAYLENRKIKDRINKVLNSFDNLLKICLEHKDILYSNSYESEDEFKNDLEKILDNSPNRDLFLARVIDVCENQIIINNGKLDTISVASVVISFLMSCEF